MNDIKLFLHTFETSKDDIDSLINVITEGFPHVKFVDYVTECDYIFASGGDGTILSAKKFALKYKKAIIGYNSGTLGFLATGETTESIFTAISNNTEHVMEIPTLCMTDNDVMPEIPESFAVNDIVISNFERGKLVNLDVFIDPTAEGFKYCADSLVIATPTGSTAYNLSAGGSIVHPSIPAILITPVAPFSMSSRPVIIPDNFSLTITSPDELFIKIDGRGNFHIEPNRELKVVINKDTITLVRLEDTFFKSIEQKLQWNHIIKQ